MSNFKIQDDIEWEPLERIEHPRSNSGQCQESFVINVLEHKRNGYYVEVGSHHPVIANNTNVLESEYGWRGVAIELDKHYADLYNSQRSNECVNDNALMFDYREYFIKNNFPRQMDYLQIDVDDTPRHANLLALIQIPLVEYRFNIITVEHDSIRDFTLKPMRDAQRLILSSLNYELVIQGYSEDFWVDRYSVPYKNYWNLHSVGGYL